MVVGLPHRVEEKIAFDQIAAAEAVVEVDRGPWHVVHDVVGDVVVAGDGLKVRRALLGERAHFVDVVTIDDVIGWKVAIGAVGAHLYARRKATNTVQR